VNHIGERAPPDPRDDRQRDLVDHVVRIARDDGRAEGSDAGG
jgi:hypothetical protein